MTSTHLKSKNLDRLKQILQRDYGVALTDEEAESFGISLLKITRLAVSAFNRAEESRSMAKIS
jgi:hypothetical protein